MVDCFPQLIFPHNLPSNQFAHWNQLCYSLHCPFFFLWLPLKAIFGEENFAVQFRMNKMLISPFERPNSSSTDQHQTPVGTMWKFIQRKRNEFSFHSVKLLRDCLHSFFFSPSPVFILSFSASEFVRVLRLWESFSFHSFRRSLTCVDRFILKMFTKKLEGGERWYYCAISHCWPKEKCSPPFLPFFCVLDASFHTSLR